ncbi:hypothetical protein [Nocardiopsis coralliicola]
MSLTWTQRITAGLAVGAAAVALPFAAAGPASAADWELAGQFGTHATCMAEGDDYINKENDNHDFTEFKCEPNGSAWQVWVR